MRYIPDDNLAYPVLIKLLNGSTGSAFYLRTNDNVMYLVSAKHVLYEKKRGQVDFTLTSNQAELISYSRDLGIKDPFKISLNLESLNNNGSIKIHPTEDVVIVKLATITNQDGQGKVQFDPGVTVVQEPAGGSFVTVPQEYFKKYDDVLISNSVIIFGYPNSVGTNDQLDRDRPLLRKGIVAGKNNLKRTIILDCPVYFGNSGGLAIEVERVPNGHQFHAIGVVCQYVPFVEQLYSLQHKTTNTNIENSGYSVVVPVDTILDLIAQI